VAIGAGRGSIRSMGWTMLYLFVVLKLPILAMCWLIWWAVRQEPDYADEGDGGSRVRPHPPAPLPRAPRRGPHGDAAPPSPPRVRRPAPARARQLS
jgi:hypothetical protein